MNEDPYVVLGVPRDATDKQIKTAYRRASAKAHPDRNGGDSRQQQRINDAYAILGDPERRARYDATGQTSDGPSEEDRFRARVETVLASLFERAINDEPGDNDRIVATCIKIVRGSNMELMLQVRSANETVKRLTKLRKRVRYAAKFGITRSDVYITVLEAAIARAENNLTLAKDLLNLNAQVLKELNDYTDIAPPRESVDEWSSQFGKVVPY